MGARWALVVAHARRLRAAAEVVQRAWRRFHAGRERRYRRALAGTATAARVAGEARRYAAAVRLQAFARAVLARAAVRRRRAEIGRAVRAAFRRLQRVGRGFQARRGLGRERGEALAKAAAAEAAAAARQTAAAATLQAVLRARRSAGLVFGRLRRKRLETAELQALAWEELRREAAVTRLQRALRRHWRRRAENQAREEAARARAWVLRGVVKLQAWWRGCLGRREAATRLARVRWLSRKRLELEDVRVLLEEELREQGERHLFCYHEGRRSGSHPAIAASHDEAEEAGPTLEDSWANIYEDDEVQV